MSFNPRNFRLQVAQHPQVTFDELDTSPRHYALGFQNALDEMLKHGWERHGRHLPTLAPPLPWNGFERSFSFHLHAWEPLSFLLKGSCTVDDPERRACYFQASFAYAMDWLTTFQLPVMDLDPSLLLSKEMTDVYGFAWYDMAVGQRIYRLAFILDTVCRDETYFDETVELLYQSLQFHHRLLAVDKFFNARSNHGLYQALGQLAAAKRFEQTDAPSARYFELASRRFSDLISAHFTADNVHKEHSPGYHYMILGSLIGARQTDLVADPKMAERLTAMEDALTWMIKPNFWIVTFGDTDPRVMGRRPTKIKLARQSTLMFLLAERFSHPALQAIQSIGMIGTLPGPGVRAYYDAGYAFARLYAPNVKPEFTRASYLAQTAAFHSRVHKHADHLSFVWFDQGRDILIDPGRYAYAGRTEIGSDLFEQGFWYSDPKRIFCETTRAHNTVEIDGRSFPRAKVKPFGSALVYAGEEDGCAATYCEATHFRYVRHNRQLIMGPGRFLLVLDWLNDRTGATHDYRQFFHFATEWQVIQNEHLIEAHHPGRDGLEPMDLRVATLIDEVEWGSVVRGQEEPELLGWLSDKANSLVPTSCFHLYQRSSGPVRFATLFVLGRTLEIDRKATRFNATLGAGQIAWLDDQGAMVLKIRKPSVEHKDNG